ncbi:unnamed protein product [Prorocentrum cordatum]|uniref:Uncharacterized protein n=1 Tax=Prorocentrum cordatum TaxID=2364126 RepID=A0ABN9VWR9_9DINO|nr:unnamed protein product [Polarella glacialis]
MSCKMLGLLALLLAPLARARLRGFPAAGAAACGGPGPSAEAGAEAPDSGFDELALLQGEVEPAQGTHEKTVQEWLEHWDDHKTHISAASERVLHNETVAAQLAKIAAGACDDDPHWQDADGDGCEIYKFAIESGKMTQEVACGGGGEARSAPGLRGVRVAADATARAFCPATCGACPRPAPPAEPAAEPLEDDVTFLQVGVSSSEAPPKSTASWLSHMHDHRSRISDEDRVLHNETVAYQLQRLELERQGGHGCVDDPHWRDADGDGCEIYRFAVESGKTTRDLVCGGGGEQAAPARLRGGRVRVVADATARVFCPVTCGLC